MQSKTLSKAEIVAVASGNPNLVSTRLYIPLDSASSSRFMVGKLENGEASRNKKSSLDDQLINCGTLGRPIGRPTPFQQKYIDKALKKAKFSAQLDTAEADKQFENANDWCTKLQHRVLALYSDKQKRFERNRLVQRLYRACTKAKCTRS